MSGQGIGARITRKEDGRYLEGRGSFVSDMLLPGQSEVAFLRSPIAHGRILRIVKPRGLESSVFISDDLVGVKPVAASSTLPGYKVSKHYPLAHGKVRFVGELVAAVVAPSRAQAEDIAERIDIEIDELPAIIDAHTARANPTSRVHDEWDDNLFLTLEYENGFESSARNATVVVEREVTMARQAMVPLEGKAVVAYWDERADQLVLYTSTQVPHMIRIGLAETLGLSEGRIRVIAPDVGGGFGYKCVLHPEEICIAWLALTYRRPFRYIEDRREHLVAGANARQHHYKLKGYADTRGRLLALDAEITIDGGAYSNWPFTIGLEPGQATGNLPGPYEFHGYRCKTYCVATNKPGFLPYRGVARTSVCFAMELLIDAIASQVGREPWQVRHDNLVPVTAMPYNNVTRKHYDSGDYPRSLLEARDVLRAALYMARHVGDAI
jgi:aerobic carbon-monoxide dehydrogenase large subunit